MVLAALKLLKDFGAQVSNLVACVCVCVCVCVIVLPLEFSTTSKMTHLVSLKIHDVENHRTCLGVAKVCHAKLRNIAGAQNVCEFVANLIVILRS